MPIHLLTAAQVEAATDGTLHDGGGLALETRGEGKHKSWFFRYNARKWGGSRGKRIGLGSARTVSLDEARRKASARRNLITRGINPKTYQEGRRRLADKQAEKQAARERTLGTALDDYFKFAKAERLWKSDNTIDTNESCKKNHLDKSGHMNWPLQSIKVGRIAEILLIIKRKGRRGMMVRARSLLNCMFNWEIGYERYVGLNPARPENNPQLEKLLGPKPVGRHRPALAFKHLPDVLAYIHTPKRDPDTWLTVTEGAYATGRDRIAIRQAYKRGLIDKSKMKKHPIRPREWLIAVETDAAGTQTLAGVKQLPIINKPVAIEREDATLYTDIIQLLIFTAARSEMIVLMKWGQIKWNEGIIEYLPETPVDDSEHKTGSDGDPDNIYRVILTNNVREILLRRKQLREDNKPRLTCNADDYVFTHGNSPFGLGTREAAPSNPNTINTAFQRIVERIDDILDKEVTIHGLRSGFSDWVIAVYKAPLTDPIAVADTSLIDATLGHQIKVFRDNKSNKAYVRSPQFKERRDVMMAEWENFLLSKCTKPLKVAESADIIHPPAFNRPAS
jgi:integrase